MTTRLCLVLLLTLFLGGCGIPSMIRANDDRYLRPGALDSPLTAVYSVYSFDLVRRFRVTYEWVSSSGCGLRGRRLPRQAESLGPVLYDVPEIYEEGGKTWQGSHVGSPPMDLDRWMGSVKVVSQAKEDRGQLVEVGLKALCMETWWGSSHFLFVDMRRSTVDALQDEVTVASKRVPIRWTRRTLNGREWRVLEVPLDQLPPRRLNSAGGPYKTWITALGDSGYSMAFSLGASKESLDHPRTHAALEATLQHLLHALKVEPLVSPTSAEVPVHK